jgi:hypothetical protein
MMHRDCDGAHAAEYKLTDNRDEDEEKQSGHIRSNYSRPLQQAPSFYNLFYSQYFSSSTEASSQSPPPPPSPHRNEQQSQQRRKSSFRRLVDFSSSINSEEESAQLIGNVQTPVAVQEEGGEAAKGWLYTPLLLKNYKKRFASFPW